MNKQRDNNGFWLLVGSKQDPVAFWQLGQMTCPKHSLHSNHLYPAVVMHIHVRSTARINAGIKLTMGLAAFNSETHAFIISKIAIWIAVIFGVICWRNSTTSG